MKIKSNASSAEISSPFYKINEDFCRKFENYISTKNGKVKGNYNAWSYLVEGKIINPTPWNLKYKKATYTSSGNLLLSSKKQNLLTMVEWSTLSLDSNNSEFEILRKDRIGLMNMILKNDFKKYKSTEDYLIRKSGNNNVPLEKYYDALKPIFDSKEIYSIIQKNKILTISLRTDQHLFDIFDKLISV